jgi:hypothetical protein
MLTTAFNTHTKNIGMWIGFLSFSLAVYYFFSSGDFSFLLVSLPSF